MIITHTLGNSENVPAVARELDLGFCLKSHYCHAQLIEIPLINEIPFVFVL